MAQRREAGWPSLIAERASQFHSFTGRFCSGAFLLGQVADAARHELLETTVSCRKLACFGMDLGLKWRILALYFLWNCEAVIL